MSKKISPRSQIVSSCLRKCALEVDPLRGYLKNLAEEIDVHPVTLHYWIANGRVPEKSAKRLQKRFGKRLADAAVLSDSTTG